MRAPFILFAVVAHQPVLDLKRIRLWALVAVRVNRIGVFQHVRRRDGLIVEERRRLKIIQNGFGEKPALKLVFGALIRAAKRWRGCASPSSSLPVRRRQKGPRRLQGYRPLFNRFAAERMVDPVISETL